MTDQHHFMYKGGVSLDGKHKFFMFFVNAGEEMTFSSVFNQTGLVENVLGFDDKEAFLRGTNAHMKTILQRNTFVTGLRYGKIFVKGTQAIGGRFDASAPFYFRFDNTAPLVTITSFDKLGPFIFKGRIKLLPKEKILKLLLKTSDSYFFAETMKTLPKTVLRSLISVAKPPRPKGVRNIIITKK